MCSKPNKYLETLKVSLTKAVADIDMNILHATFDDERRLREYIKKRKFYVTVILI